MKVTKGRIIKLILSLLVSALAVFFLLRNVSLNDIAQVLTSAKPGLLLIGLVFYFLMVVLRAARFHVFFKGEIAFKKLLSIASLHNFFNEFLPLRSGELVYLYLIKQSQVVGSRNLSSLIIVRLMDFMTVIILALGSLWLLLQQGEVLPSFSQYAWLLPLILVIGIISFILFIKYFHPLLNLLFKLFFKFNKIQNKLHWIENKAEELTQVLRQIWTKQFTIKIIARSFLLWLVVIVSYFFILQSLGISLSLIEMAFVIMFPAIVTVLPIQGVAGVGTFEAAIGLGLVSIGIAPQTAIATSFAMHVMIWLFATGTGIMGFLTKIFDKSEEINN